MAPQRRSAALVISAYVTPGASPQWFARISYYRDPFSPAVSLPAQTTADGVVSAIVGWLQSVVGDEATDGASVTMT
jgi:hypothetical protein